MEACWPNPTKLSNVKKRNKEDFNELKAINRFIESRNIFLLKLNIHDFFSDNNLFNGRFLTLILPLTFGKPWRIAKGSE